MSIHTRSKWVVVLAVALLVGALLILGGCGQKKEASKEPAPGPAPKTEQKAGAPAAKSGSAPLKITLAGYSPGGASAAVGQAVGEAIVRTVPGTSFSYEPGQSGANEIKVSRGETQLGLSSSLLVGAAAKGQDPYKQSYKNLRAIAFLHTSDVQFIVDKRSGLKSIEDFKTKPVRLATNTKNSFMEITARAAMNAYGITYENLEKRGGKVYLTNLNTALEQMRNRQLDAIVMATLTPTTLFVDAATTLNLDLLPMSDAAIEKTNQAVGSRTVTIPKSSYPFMSADQKSSGIDNILIASAEMPEETAYTIAKALYNNMDYLYQASVTLKQMNKQNISQVGRGVPLHPGAEKFYREVGALK